MNSLTKTITEHTKTKNGKNDIYILIQCNFIEKNKQESLFIINNEIKITKN